MGNIAPESHFQLPPKPVSCSVITIDATQSITSALSKRIGPWSNTLWQPTAIRKSQYDGPDRCRGSKQHRQKQKSAADENG
jgi:hypothetical protein